MRPPVPRGKSRLTAIRRRACCSMSRAHTALCRRHARTPRGGRASGQITRTHGHNITLMAALTSEGIGPSRTRNGSLDSAACAGDVLLLLAPSLHSGQVDSRDTHSAHRRAAARQAVGGIALADDHAVYAHCGLPLRTDDDEKCSSCERARAC